MITVVGLGDGGPESLTLAALEHLRNGSALRVARDPRHPAFLRAVQACPGAAADATVDLDGPGDLAERFARGLIRLASEHHVVYFVHGDPLRDDAVTLFLTAVARASALDLQVLSPGGRSSGPSLTGFSLLLAVMARLRDPERGCPWDNEQTLASLKRYVLEEAYEVLEAIDHGDPRKHAEELGDLLLQVVFQAQLTREAGDFGIEEAIAAIVDKLIRRHPHVFGDVAVSGPDQVVANWEAIKRAEPGYEDRSSILDGIPGALPALMRAMEVSKRVVKVGFEWPSVDEILDKVDEEMAELRAELRAGKSAKASDELGDLLFTLVNVARQLGVDPEDSLRRMTLRFADRFKRIERHAQASGRALSALSLPEMEEQWAAAKAEEAGI